MNAFDPNAMKYIGTYTDFEDFLLDAPHLIVSGGIYSKYKAEVIPYDKITGMEEHVINDFIKTINRFAKKFEAYAGLFEISGSRYVVQGCIDRDKSKYIFLLIEICT